MRKKALVVLAILVLIMLVSGCNLNPRSKALIVVNDSVNTDIEIVEIQQNIVGSRFVLIYNALPDNEVIAPGEEMTFYLAPYAVSDDALGNGWSNLRINRDLPGGASKYFSFDPDMNEAVTATYDGTEIVLSGSDVATPPPV